jgi:thiamine pyrophosphate-dependent acetolactate synthase large subunit-like protein
MTAVDAIACVLREEGTSHVSCFPHAPLIDACVAVGIRPVVARSERVVVNIADGFSRGAREGRVGVCIVQREAGIENAFAGVAQAYADSVPILMLPSAEPLRREGVPPGFDAPRQFAGVTKWAATVNAADRVPELMRRAFIALRCGRPGPVLLSLPNDVAGEVIDGAEHYTSVPRWRAGPDPSAVRRAVDLLFSAQRPVMIAGAGIHAAGAYKNLLRLADQLRLPVATTMNGKGAIPENHPLALGVGGLSATAMVDHFLRGADLVLAIGTSLTRWWMAAPLPQGVPIVQCTVDERDLGKDYAIEHAVPGDAALVLDALADEAEDRLQARHAPSAADPTNEIDTVRRAWLAEWEPLLSSDEVPINPYRVVRELMLGLDRKRAIVTHESGFPRDQMAPFFESLTPLGYVGWGHSTQLGYSLGLAIGMKLAHPERPVVNVMGDASIGMVGMDIETAVRARIGIVTIVLNNGVMAGYEAHIPLASERHGAKVLGGDYAGLGAALGAHAGRVTRPDEIRPALDRALAEAASGRPSVLEILTREETRIPTYW